LDVWIASSDDGSWQARLFAHDAAAPDLFTSGQATFIAWQRAGRIVAAEYRGSWRTHTFGTRGTAPRVDASAGQAFVAWTTSSGQPFVVQRRTGPWVGTNLYPNHVASLQAVASHRGLATALFVWRGTADPFDSRLMARTQG
jgi:hypothetical protein